MTDTRSEELAQRLAAVRERVVRAVEAAGRDDVPELIVVTKYFPAGDVVRLYELGVREVGENKDQEASAKAQEAAAVLRERHGGHYDADPLHWHFIGQLQSNKAKSVVRYASAVHSADRSSLVKALKKAVARMREQEVEPSSPDPRLACLIQVDLRQEVPEDDRGGAAPDEIPQLAASIAEAEGLDLAGLMAVAPLDEPAGPAFARLQDLHRQLIADHPGATMLSAGMSGDVEEAVAHGATHLRIGREVLGERPYAR